MKLKLSELIVKLKLSEVIVEIVIFFIGAIISIVSLISPTESGAWLAVIIFVITLSTDIIIISTKYYIKSITDQSNKKTEKMIVSFFDTSFGYKLNKDNVDEKWRDKVTQSFEEFKNRMQGLYEGDLLLSYEELFFYQNELIKKTNESLDAIHIADSVESLKLWDPERSETSKFKSASFYACKDLNHHVKKRRLFIIASQLEKDNKDLIDRVVKSQINDLKFEVKKIYIEDIGRKYKMPYDIMISDKEEVIEIEMRFNRVESAHSYINKSKVAKAIDEFKKLWGMADEFINEGVNEEGDVDTNGERVGSNDSQYSEEDEVVEGRNDDNSTAEGQE